MNRIVFDIPLLIIGFGLLGWARFFRTERDFQILCQFVATFNAQVSAGISWSLGRTVPIFSSTSFWRVKTPELSVFLPFFVYVFVSSPLASFFWNIPSDTAFFYGEGRVILQLTNFLFLFLSTRALTGILRDVEAVYLLWKMLKVAVIIHGLASFYQWIALEIGLPLIGISRSHGLTLGGEVGDIARFVSQSGREIIRPGGLAGEPKTVAVIFGIVFLASTLLGFSLDRNKRDKYLSVATVILSAFGFVVASSTSAFFGEIATVVFFYLTGIYRYRKNLFYSLVFLIVTILIILAIFLSIDNSGLDDLKDIFFQRTFNRLMDEEMDPPVEAALVAMRENPLILVLGVGAGGSSFLVMEFLNESFKYAYAPNIGFILLLVEHGLVGVGLFLGVFFFQVMKVVKRLRKKESNEIILLFSVGVSTMILCMCGSGIPLGYPLAVACIIAATQLKVH